MNFSRDIQTRYRIPRPARHQSAPAAQAPAQQQAQHHQTPHAHHTKPKKFRANIFKKWWLIVIVLLIAGVAVLAYGYVTTLNDLNAAKKPSAAGNTDTDELINKVGQLLVLPSGEKPTIATVNDASKVKNQEFFANAQNGDKVLIYAKADRAILYRPSANKIVEYSKVNLGENQ